MTLNRYLYHGQTILLMGSSGAGKSTLINRLSETDRIATQAVRGKDSKGRHTTTRRDLITLPGGISIIDSPGIRELQVWSDHQVIDEMFPDVFELAEMCRFRDCSHTTEPGCAVTLAVENRTLSHDRLRSYLKLHREVTNTITRKQERMRIDEKRVRKSSKKSRESDRMLSYRRTD